MRDSKAVSCAREAVQDAKIDDVLAGGRPETSWCPSPTILLHPDRQGSPQMAHLIGAWCFSESHRNSCLSVSKCGCAVGKPLSALLFPLHARHRRWWVRNYGYFLLLFSHMTSYNERHTLENWQGYNSDITALSSKKATIRTLPQIYSIVKRSLIVSKIPKDKRLKGYSYLHRSCSKATTCSSLRHSHY